MTYIKTLKLTPHEARSLQEDGFIVKFVRVYGYAKDLYKVFVEN